MIDSNELKQGNLVFVGEYIISVEDVIKGCGINMHHDCWEYKLCELSPICLTENILSNLGFTKSGDYWFLNNFIIWEWGIYNVSYHSERIYHKDDERYNIIEFKSLHHLQNCFYFATGVELNVNKLIK